MPFLIFIANAAFSQGKYEDSIRNIIKKDFIRIEPKDFKNLVPYEGKKGKGYLNKVTHKTVLKPSYYDLDLPKPTLKGNYNDVAYFEIDPETKDIKVFIQNWRIFEESRDYQGPIKKGYARGFHVVNNVIFSYSDTYTYCPNLFRYKDRDFAIAIKDKKYAVIDPDGETLPHLGFEYSDLVLYTIGNDNVCFRYKTLQGEEGFINMEGQKSLVNDIISNSRSQTRGYFSFIDTENSVTINYYGYIIETNEELYGVLDLTTMNWVIRPQKALKIVDINYSTDKKLNGKYDLEDRKDLQFYFEVLDEKKQRSYYIDEKLKKYLP